MPKDTLLLDHPADLDDDFALDVRVLVTYAPASRSDCPTDDGCGSTCASACSSSYDIPA